MIKNQKTEKLMKKAIKIIALMLTLAILSCLLLACGANTGKALLVLDDQSVSVNLYKFYLSRIKGTLASYGYDVTSETFWNTVIDIDGTTWEDYYLERVLDETRESLAILKLFSELEKQGKVKLSDAHKAEINETVQTLIEYDADGSSTAFNAILGEYDANIDVLKLAYEIEIKKDILISHYFGNGGSMIADTVKEEYMRENYVAFKQILIANYYYEYVCDKNGDPIYYTETGKVAYDKVNGEPKYDELGAPIYDAYGNIVYYNSDGSIAYDVANGKRKNVTDDKGNAKIKYYSESELDERFKTVEEIVEKLKDGDTALFEAYMLHYAEEANASPDDLAHAYYLKKNETSPYGYINTIKDALVDIEIGEIRVVPSDFGYHIVMKYELEEGAYSDDDNSTWFEDFNSSLTGKLLKNHTGRYISDIVMVEGLIDGISMLDIGINFYY